MVVDQGGMNMNRKELLRRIFAAEQQLAGLKARLERRREQAPVIEVVDRTGDPDTMSALRPRQVS